MRKLPKDFIPISICGKAPDWYTGLQYKKLAPKYGFFMEWKKNHDNDYYIKCFNEQVLDKLIAQEVDYDLYELAGANLTGEYPEKPSWVDVNIVLLCYEKPSDFCHRHLVADWLTSNGCICKEFVAN